MKYERDIKYQEIRVDSIEEIYDIISEYNDFYELPRAVCGESLQSFYRGQKDSAWNILPSLSRAEKGETEIISEYLRKDELKNITLFELIAHIQHYHDEEIGTRFIDFSTDPNIALYFACSNSESSDTDGALFIQSFACHEPAWYTVKVICELALISDEEITVKEFAERLMSDYSFDRNRFRNIDELCLGIVSFLDYGIPVVPDERALDDNIRLKRQKGCFFICGTGFKTNFENNPCMRFLNQCSKCVFEPKKAVVPEVLNDGNCLVKIIIPKELKQEIRLHLKECFGITENYLFPDGVKKIK
nr:MAG TPA: This domain contains a conserved N-terminal (F/Y)RG motif [Caudoviricetes sp.]